MKVQHPLPTQHPGRATPEILVVDDDPEFRMALGGVLVGAGMAPHYAADGNEALRALDEHHKSLRVVVVDLNLRRISGFEVIGVIARRKTNIGIVAATRAYRQHFLDVAEHLGAHIALRKPYDLRELSAWIPIIQSLVRRDAGPPHSTSA